MIDSSIEARLREYCEKNHIAYSVLLKDHGLIQFATEQSPWNKAVRAAVIADQRHRNQFLLLAMNEIRILCENNNIDHVFLKGIPVGQELYDPKELRTTRDVDILVRYEDVKRLVGCLKEKGYSFSDNGVPLEDPLVRIRNCHHHLRAMGKSYKIEGEALLIEVEIHVFPFARGYDLLGHTRTDLTYTDIVLARKRSIELDGNPFAIPSITDNALILMMHMISHMCLDLVLFLYVKKPFQYQSVLPMIIDLARIVEIYGKRIDIEELIRMAKQLDQTYELLFADHLLRCYFDLNLLDGIRVDPTNNPTTPLSTVCSLLQEINPVTLLFPDHLQDELSLTAIQHVTPSDNAFDTTGIHVRLTEKYIALILEEPVENSLFGVDFYYLSENRHLKTDSYVIELQEESVRFLRDNGFRQIWGPEFYGQSSEKELRSNYSVVYEKARGKSEYIIPWPNDTSVEMSSPSSKFAIRQISEINPFLNKNYSE